MPEGTASGAYKTSWIVWNDKEDKGGAVKLRFRTTRIEFERYLQGILRMEREFRESHRSLLGKGVDFALGAEVSEGKGLDLVEKRREGIPKLVGYLERPPTTMEEYARLKQKAERYLRLSSAPE